MYLNVPPYTFLVFFNAGWSSFDLRLTAKHYGIPCTKLQIDDLCLPPSHPEATFAVDVFASFERCRLLDEHTKIETFPCTIFFENLNDHPLWKCQVIFFFII